MRLPWRRALPGVLPEYPDFALGGGNEAQDHLQEGALAGAVGAEHAHEGALLYVQSDILQHGLVVVRHPQVPDVDDRGAHFRAWASTARLWRMSFR
jgi:hypothetical protein